MQSATETASRLLFFFAKLLHVKPNKHASGEQAKLRAVINEGVSPRRKNKRLLTLLFCLRTTKLSAQFD